MLFIGTSGSLPVHFWLEGKPYWALECWVTHSVKMTRNDLKNRIFLPTVHGIEMTQNPWFSPTVENTVIPSMLLVCLSLFSKLLLTFRDLCDLTGDFSFDFVVSAASLASRDRQGKSGNWDSATCRENEYAPSPSGQCSKGQGKSSKWDGNLAW